MVTQTMTNISGLVRLQETDLALDSRRATLSDAESRIGETEELTDLRARVVELRDALHSADGTQKDVELEADDLKAKIAPLEPKLYSGAIKNPQELSDLQADIDQLKRQLSAIEDRDLEALSRSRRRRRTRATQRQTWWPWKQSWATEQAELAETHLAAGGGDRRAGDGAPGAGGRHRERASAAVRPRASGAPGPWGGEAGPEPVPGVPDLAAGEHREQGEGGELRSCSARTASAFSTRRP